MENKTDAILEGLNEEQKAAVINLTGPILIVAGAGSGKTRVLTSRIAYILAKGGSPDRILSLTFTKKAATEMKDRIAAMVGKTKARKLCMGTFHSVFIRFLREFADKIGYPSSFTIYDQGDSISLIKTCIKELGLPNDYKPKQVLSRISKAKNNLFTAEAYRSNPQILEADKRSRIPRVCDIYSAYSAKCKAAGVMDFDDILLNMNILLKISPEACDSIGRRFNFIMVDEYQDTNFSQYLILKRLAAYHGNICVVGDDSQSIYAFRGARIENILNFRKDYPNNKIFRLEKNYRSSQIIVNAANSLIARNENRIPKECVSMGDKGDKIKLISAYDEKDEALMIADDIQSKIRFHKAEYKDFAIMYRTNAQSRSIEEALRKKNLPYVVFSGTSFFDRAEVKDFMAYFKLTINNADDESFKRIVNLPKRGIGGTSLDRLIEAAHDGNMSLFDAAAREDLAKFSLSNAAISRIKQFRAMIAELSQYALTEDAHNVAKKVAYKTGLYQYYQDKLKEENSTEAASRVANIDELFNAAKIFEEETLREKAEAMYEHEQEQLSSESVVEIDVAYADQLEQEYSISLADFLENISLLSSVDMEDGDDNRIGLMTVHSSKGLEFPHVYVTGMEENLFPSGSTFSSPEEIEEERRLFYVAMTRAEKTLSLSFADTRMRNGKHENNPPSRFVKEINHKYIENPISLFQEEGNNNFASTSFETERFEGGFGRSAGGSRGGFTGDRGTFRRNSNATKKTSEETFGQKIQKIKSRPLPPKTPDSQFKPMNIMELAKLKSGDRIEHNRFGAGLITSTEGEVPEMKIKVTFDKYGPKTLLVKYAKLRLI